LEHSLELLRPKALLQKIEAPKEPEKPKIVVSGLMRNILTKHEVLRNIVVADHDDILDDYSETNTYYE
jgi:hypothetical protein